jgi:MoxR-like ATPase/ssDNA-binding Zn-finger/Zn-ribbon topoisomerase 1
MTVQGTINRANNRYQFNCPECKKVIRVGAKNKVQRKTCPGCRSVYRVTINLREATTSQTVMGPEGKPIPRGVTLSMVEIAKGGGAVDITPEMVERRLANELEQIRGKYLAELKAEAMAAARKEIQTLAPTELKLVSPIVDKPRSVKGTRHPAYGDIMESLATCGQALLVGPPGTGKSTLARLIAEDLGVQYVYYPCTEGLSEAHLLGRMDMNGKYIASDLVKALENPKGCVILFDEMDAADPNASLVVNELLANRIMALPNRPSKPMVHATFDKHLIIAGANTWGTGTSVEHTGRNTLDAALLDRFVGLSFFIDYDPTLEAKLAEQRGSTPLLNVLWRIRENVRANRVRRPVSTRAVINLGNLHHRNPEKYTYRALLDRFFMGWSEQEKSKALMGVDLSNLSDGEQDAPATDVQPTNGEKVPDCPQCGRTMVKRTARRGRHAGSQFWGCSGFKDRSCNAIVSIKEVS